MLAVDSDHPAIRGAVIAFMVERSPRPVGSPDETDRQRVAAHTTASGAPATVKLAASGLGLLASRWLLAIRLSLLWQPGGLGRAGGSAPLVAGSRAGGTAWRLAFCIGNLSCGGFVHLAAEGRPATSRALPLHA